MASGNRWLVQLLCDDLYSLIRLFRYRASVLRPEPKRSHTEHRAIVTALQARDGEGAERWMREHVRGSRERLIGHLRRSSASAA
jgi:DNA-binding GntR family transcriptional regulator